MTGINPYVFVAVFTGTWVAMSVVAWFTVIRHERKRRLARESIEDEMFFVFAKALKANLSRSLLPKDREYVIATRFMHVASLPPARRNRPVFLEEIERENQAFDSKLFRIFKQPTTNGRPC